MLKARSRVADVPGVVWVLNRSLFIVAIMLALLVSAGVVYAQGTPTVPTIESVAVTSDPGEDGGYAIGDEIQVGLTFSEAVTVTGVPQISLDVGGQSRTAEYSEGSTTTQLLFTYTVPSGDEDTDGIAVVANSLALNGGAIRAGSANATLTHAGLNSADHKVDGIAPTVTVDGETRTYVPPGRQFNVVFNFSEKVYGITDDEITVTNGLAVDVRATGGTDTWPRYTRWDVIIVPAAEGPVTVTLEEGAGADAYGNGNTAPDSQLEVIAATPVTVEVARTTSGFAEGGRAEFTVTRSGDNGAIPVFLSLDQTGDLLSGSVEVYPPADPNNPNEPVVPEEVAFTETPYTLNVTFAAGETRKRIAVLTEDDYRVENDGTVTLSVPARTDQYKYIPGPASSATADVRDNDVPAVVSLYWGPPFHPYDPVTELDTALEGGSIDLVVFGIATGEPLLVTLAVTEVGSYLDLDGEGARGYEDLGNGKLRVTLPVGQLIESVSIPLLENAVMEADGSVIITIESDLGRSYTPSADAGTVTVPVKDNDTPSTVSISAPDSITEGGPLSYTLTRTWAPGESQGELSVNVKLAQTGDYISWPTAHQPDADGLVTIPVNFAARSLTATLTLETVDDQMSEDNGSVTATILADADGSYVTGADSAHTTKLLDNDLPVISVAAVSAEVTEGTDAQFRFSRAGNTSVATRVGLWVGGLPKIMTDATDAIALTADNADLSQRLHIYGAWVDYILEFAAGETEKTLSLTTEADNVNEGDGLLGVTIVQRVGNPFGIGAGYAQVLVKDDDIPTVSLTQPVGPTGFTLSADGTTWEGQLGETDRFTLSSVCTGVTEFSPDRRTNLAPLALWVMYANHPAHYGEDRQNQLGSNFANVRSVGGGDCAGTVRSVAAPLVGPENGLLEIELLAQSEFVPTGSPWNRLRPKVYDDFITQYEEAARAAAAAGTLITQKGIFSPARLTSNYQRFHCLETDFRYCPKYLVGTVNKIRLTVINRDPTILIKAENSQVEEGEPARFVVERLWNKALYANPAPVSTTVVSLRATQNGQYITGALPVEVTFGQNELRKVIELQTVDDGAFGPNGSLTIELLPDTTSGNVNLSGKYTTWTNWLGHTPDGGRSDRATVAIINNDDKPGISIAPAWALEGDTGSADMTFTVTLAKAVTEAVTINYATSDGTAIAGQDYTAVSNGSVTIAAGNTTAELTVSVTGDETDELDETFNVTISLPSDTTAAAITGGDTAAAAGTILDDDPAVVTVAPKVDTVEEGEEVVFVLTRTGVTDEELYMLVDVEDPARRRLMIAKFDADAVTTELSVATENNDLVDYPSERDYTIHLYGDGYFGGRDDERYTPGDPDEATITVQDNDALVVVTVEPVKEVVGAGESVQFRFRRTGSIAGALTISFQGFEHPSSGDATLADASVTFLAGNDTVVYTNDVTSSGTVNPISRAHTVLIYGDAGRGGLHRSWLAGDPNRATVFVAVDALGPMPVTASYPSRVAAAESVSVEYTVTNLGTRALLGYEDRVSGGTRISTTPDRGNCDIRDEIPAGESRTCSASFTVTNQDVTNGKIEFNATARNHHKSSTLRVYIRVAQPVEFGFTTADTLEVTEGPNVTATLPVTRTGRLDEAVTVVYRLRPQSIRPAALGEDFTDPSSTPGLLTFPANVTSANIVINITQDQIDEERERFRVVLVPLTDGTITEGKNSRVVLIIDEHQGNDPYRPTASLQLVSSGPVPENEGPVEFAIVLDRVWGREGRYEVEVLLDQTTATPGFAALGKEGDFEEPLIRILRIPAGQTRFEFSVPLYDDDVREEDETFLLQLTSPYDDSFRTIGVSNRALATIADDDRIPPTEVVLSLSHNGSALESVPEGASRQDITVTASFPQIRWPGDASNAPLRPADPRDVDTTVRVQLDPNSGATHAAGLDDFEPLKVEDDQGAFGDVESFDIVIPAGQTIGTATLRFTPVKDDVDEEDETVTLSGSVVAASSVENSLPVVPASFTIIDDDTRGITVSPSSALIDLSLVEGGESGTYSLVLDSQPTDMVVITLAGNQGGFLRIVPDTLTFTTADWATPQTVSVMAMDDGIAGGAPPTDFVTHQVSGGDYGSVTVPDISTLIEDTTKAFVYLEGGQASESDGYVEFTVTVRPILRTTPVLVRYATVDGTAIAGSDYTREVTTDQTYKILNIPAGQSTGIIRIPITDNQVYGPAKKTFTLQLTNQNNKANLEGDATSLTATGSILDDDPKPVVSVAGPAGDMSYVSENVKDPVTFTLTLVGQSAGDVTVDYATGEAGLLDQFTARQGLAGATENEDYAGTSGTVTFTPGLTTKTVTVQVTNDDVSEDTEFFGFKISKPQGADLRGQRSEDVADVGLLDDDARGVTIDPTSISLHEPAAGGTAVAGAYTMKLSSSPTDTVTVTIGGGDPAVSLSGDTLTNNQVTFTTTNWNTAQTITVTPVKDDNAVGETITLTHTLSGGDYAGIAADSVTVSLTDSDARNLVLSEESLAVTEGDATGVGYTVKLATQPSDTVTVAISGHDGADLTLSGTTLTFMADNWDAAQTVTVKALEDDDGANDTGTLTHSASGGDYASVTKNLPVSITDDDEAAIVLSSETGLTVTEGYAAGSSYTVKLATEPSGSVSVSITGHAGTDVTLDKTTLTFTVDNWDTAQTVTVKAGEDDDAANDSATLTHTASGGDYVNVAKKLTVTVSEDDEADIVLSETGLTVTEGDAAGTSYTVALATLPSDTVIVTISGHNAADLMLHGTTLTNNQLTFTTTNWGTAQTVTVKAGQDDDAANDTATLTHTASGGDYASITVDLPVTVTDDDTAGVTIEPTALSVVAGRSNEYTVRLATEPSGDVTVTVSGHAGTAVSLDKTTLTFTVNNWDTVQTVTVSATQNAATAKVTLAHAVAGADYGSVTAEPVVVSVVAMASAGQQPTLQVGVSELTQTLTVPEGGANSYILVVSSRPTGDVAVGVTLPTGTDLTLDKTTLTFTSTNWDVAQTVTVTAAEDDDGVTDVGVTLTHTVSGGGYGSTTVPDVEVSITENDTAGVTIEPTTLSVVAGRSNEYTAALATEPSGEVTVTVSGHAGTAVSLDKTTLTFTVDNWDVVQTVAVTAGQDDDAANDSATLTHTASGGDYASVSNTLPVTVTDDDTPDIVLSETGLTVTEGDAAGSSYTVVLATRPSGSVSVSISGHDGTDLTLSGTTLTNNQLTFTTTSWGAAQTVTVKAGEDDDAANDTATLTHTASGSDYANVTKNLPVSIIDDDVPVTVQFGATTYEVVEGETVTIAVTLSADPERTVVIPITHTPQSGADSPADYSGVPPSVTFNTGQMSQTITFTAAQDDVDDDGESVLLGFGTLPPAVSLGTTTQATVSITDDDDPQVAVSFDRASYRVLEGDTVTVGVTLSGDPKRTVEIPLTATDYGGVTSVDYSGVPTSVTINAGETSKTFEFMAMADDASDTGESVMIGFGTSLPSRVTEGTPNEARVTINQMSTQFSLDCSLTATVWCADLGFSDRVAENYGWLYMRYGHGWDPPSSLSDDDFRFRGVDYDVRSMELLAGTHPVMPNAWSTWQQGYSSFRIGIYWDHRWGAPSEEHYRDWVLHLDGLELPFKDALRHGSDFVWVGAEFQQVFNDWTPSTVTKIGIKEVAAADQDTNPLLPWAPMQVDAWPEGPDRLLIVWAKPASFYPGLPDPTSYTVQWKLASADWSDSAAVSQLEVAATSNFRAVIVNGMTEDAVYSVRVIASNDAGDGPPSEETLGRPQDSLPRLIARTVNRQTLTLRFSEQLDPNAVPAATNFVVKADGGLIMVDSVAISGDEVILTLHHAVTAATHSVLVRYDKPTDPSAVFLQDTNGNYANIRQHHELLEVVNITPQSSVQPLTAQFTNMPSSHDGRTRFTFDIEFSEPVWIGDGLARDDMLEITGGTVISAPWKDRRTDKFIVHVRPDTQGDIVIVLPGHRACHGIVGSYREVPDPVAGAPCAVGSRVLTNEPTVTIPGPSSPAQQQVVENTPAEGEPRIDGSPEVGQTLSADTTAIADADGLEEVVFQYQWLADDADIPDATGSTYTVVSGDVGQAIRVRVTFTDDAGHEETLTSAPTTAVTAAGLQLQSATVDGGTLTLTYSEELDTGVTLGTTPFAVSVNGSSRLLIAVGVGESNVLLLLSSAVEAGDTVTVDYTAPDGPDFIRDIRGRKAASFSRQAVTNDTASASDETASAPLMASVHDAPASHDGQTAFIFELRFSEDPEPDFSYTTVRDHAFTVTGGAVTYVRRLEPGKNVRWEITVTPVSSAAVAIALNATTDCSTQGAICTEEGGKLSGGLLLVVPGPNTPATGVPTITGTARVGETLTSDTTGISDGDGLGNAAFNYQWLADDAEVNGATDSIYTLAATDAGKTIRVKVSFTDDAGNDEELTSAATGAVAAAPPPPNTPATGVPTITGTARVGETLTSDTTGISDGDGLDNATFAYQWLADDAEINGANASTYTLVAADAGKTVKVKVSFTDDAGNGEELTSAATGAVAAAPPPPPPNTPATGLPTITGAAQVGETLTADTTVIEDADGLDNATFAYQWFADDAEINGANASTYTLVAADADKTITVKVFFTDAAGNDEDLTSAATGAVAAASPPPNTPATGVPTISGTAQVGETLIADTTGISDDDGLDNAVFAYQWLADDAEINGATASTYTLTDADAGKAIKVRVSFTDDAGNDEQLTSAATGAVAAAVVKPPLTATVHDVQSSHNGQDAFIFELRFSEDPKPDFSYTTVRDHAFTVTGGSVTYVRRLEPGKNVRWEITVTPDSSAAVAIALNATTDCEAGGAICTEDGRMLSDPLELTVNGPGQ